MCRFCYRRLGTALTAVAKFGAAKFGAAKFGAAKFGTAKFGTAKPNYSDLSRTASAIRGITYSINNRVF
ncbi:MAG: hypothetical protein ACJAWC_001502, partial [Yoonia sp.]